MDQAAQVRSTVPSTLRLCTRRWPGRWTGRRPPSAGAFQRQSFCRPVGEARFSVGGEAASARLGAVVGPGLRRHLGPSTCPGGDGRVDPHGHAGPRRRSRRGHPPPPSRYGQRPLGQRSQHPVGRLPVRPGHVPGQFAGRHFCLPGRSASRPGTCAKASCGRSKAAGTTT